MIRPGLGTARKASDAQDGGHSAGFHPSEKQSLGGHWTLSGLSGSLSLCVCVTTCQLVVCAPVHTNQDSVEGKVWRGYSEVQRQDRLRHGGPDAILGLEKRGMALQTVGNAPNPTFPSSLFRLGAT